MVRNAAAVEKLGNKHDLKQVAQQEAVHKLTQRIFIAVKMDFRYDNRNNFKSLSMSGVPFDRHIFIKKFVTTQVS
jgi:hypothetical protein